METDRVTAATPATPALAGDGCAAIWAVVALPLVVDRARADRRRASSSSSRMLVPGQEFDWTPADHGLRRAVPGRRRQRRRDRQHARLHDPAGPRRPVGRAGVQGRPLQHRRAGPVPDGRPRRRSRSASQSSDRRRSSPCRSPCWPGCSAGPPGASSRASSRPSRAPTRSSRRSCSTTSRSAILAAAVSGPLDQPGSPSPITDDVGNAALPDHHRPQRAHRHPPGARGGLPRRVAAGPDDARLRDPDGRRQPRRRAIRRHAPTLAHRPDDDAGGRSSPAPPGRQRARRDPRMTASFGTTVGFDAIAVALLARANPYRDRVRGAPVRRDARRGRG